MIRFRGLSLALMLLFVPTACLFAQTPQETPSEGQGEFKERLVLLYKDRAEGFDPCYQSFLKFLETGDKEKMAELVEFPIHAYVKGKKVKIPNKKAFVANFDGIFYPGFTKKIAESSKSLFVLGQGVTVGQGLVWFAWYSKPSSGWKIKSINNSGY